MYSHQLIVMDFIPFPELTADTLIIACPVMIHNYGLPYYLEGFRQLKNRHPALDLQLAIPCQDNVGLALKALEAGVKVLYFTKQHKAWPQLVTTAQTCDATILSQEELDDRMDHSN